MSLLVRFDYGLIIYDVHLLDIFNLRTITIQP